MSNNSKSTSMLDEPFESKDGVPEGILRVGTDCSGIEAPIQALRQLKIPFKHVFSSEIDKYCIQSIKANYHPEIIFGDKDGPFPEGDITKRNIEDVPDIDLYVCGFPCQPFSSAGKRKGLKDKRGNVFWSCLEVIEEKQPKYFVLENVKGILSQNNGKTWKIICDELSKLIDYGYNIEWKVLNTKDYGIPQNRERVYIIGIKNKDSSGGTRKDIPSGSSTIPDIHWPSKIKLPTLDNYIDETNTKYEPTIRIQNKKIDKKWIFIDLNFIKTNSLTNASLWSPTLNTQNGLWCVPLHRYATIKERLKLQGFPINFKQNVSNSQLVKQTGNSMSVNVLKYLFKKKYFLSLKLKKYFFIQRCHYLIKNII
jgi:DNA (cytosine-5)-methyltransferase 1